MISVSKTILEISKFQKWQKNRLISGPVWLVCGPKFSLWLNFYVWQNRHQKYLLYSTVPKACSMLHTKNKIKKASNLAAAAQKVLKSCKIAVCCQYLQKYWVSQKNHVFYPHRSPKLHRHSKFQGLNLQICINQKIHAESTEYKRHIYHEIAVCWHYLTQYWLS